MSSATRCLYQKNIHGKDIVFKVVRHNQSVELIVERVGDADVVSRITSSSKILVTGVALSSLLTHQEVSVYLCVSLFLMIMCWSMDAFTVTSERIQVSHFADGLQYSRYYRLGFRKVVFIHTQRVIMNEVVTMQRVMVFLSCIVGPADRLRGRNSSLFHLIPLFTHLHPGLQILTAIYNEIQDAFHEKDQSDCTPAANNHTNHSCDESLPNNHSLHNKSFGLSLTDCQ